MNHWYHPDSPWLNLFKPLEWLYRSGFSLHRTWQQRNRLSWPVPIIVVGNLTVGGTGKTPIIIALAELLQHHGYQPGIISRGYKRRQQSLQQVTAQSSVDDVGDEPLLMAKRLPKVPLVVSSRRNQAIAYLLQHTAVNVILSDDGLQHHALHRDIELVVIDGLRRFGNQRCLPLGPLREPLTRLKTVDFCLVNGSSDRPGEYPFQLQGQTVVNLATGKTSQLADWQGQTVHAIAGIGHPERFFQQLSQQQLRVIPHPFADHHAFKQEDLAFNDAHPRLMTEKDAIKCQPFATGLDYYLPVAAKMDNRFIDQFLSRLTSLSTRRQK
jgi:tetraacyldisaccharide 4'-kinase